ncbi:MAG: hypothetical protein VYB40_04910 [Candidatus Thermoplasmatota archaeon]|nr:hypothetical protein [Candidatus Thermoplasmatota archaeon]
MHASGKIFMGIGLVLVLIGGGMFAWGANSIDDAGDSLEENKWALEGVTTGTVEIVDNDGEGELGFTIFIEGTYEDANEDGVWDFCEGFDQGEDQQDFTTTHTGDDNNSFYYACSSDWNWEDTREEGDKMLVKIGDSAGGYTNGTATVNCASACWVQYDDQMIGDVLDDVGKAAGGFLAALGSTCFFAGGGCLLIVGLILGLTINDKSQTVVVQGGAPATMVGTPGAAMPVMGAPVAAAPMAAAPMAAAPMAAAPVAQPDPAQEYYNGLIAQGYDAASASQYTAQHYPGFQG